VSPDRSCRSSEGRAQAHGSTDLGIGSRNRAVTGAGFASAKAKPGWGERAVSCEVCGSYTLAPALRRRSIRSRDPSVWRAQPSLRNAATRAPSHSLQARQGGPK
jgi:hypothetical protein